MVEIQDCHLELKVAPQNKEGNDTAYFDKYPVWLPDISSKQMSPFFNEILIHEISTGQRPIKRNTKTDDILDSICRETMVGNSRECGINLPLSAADIDFLKEHYEAYADAKKIPKEERLLQGLSFFHELHARLEGTKKVNQRENGVDVTHKPTSKGSLLGKLLRRKGLDSEINPNK